MMWAGRSGSWPAARDVFLTTYRNTCKLHEAIAGTEMLTHEFVTKDRRAAHEVFRRHGGCREFWREILFWPYRRQELPVAQNGFAAKGPKIEQSLAVSGGRPVTIIRAGSYQYDDSRTVTASESQRLRNALAPPEATATSVSSPAMDLTVPQDSEGAS